MNIAGELIIAVIVFLFGGLVTIGKMWMGALKEQVKQLKLDADSREKSADARMREQEEKTVEQVEATKRCYRDREVMKTAHTDLQVRTEVVERTLKVIRKCPEPKCPNTQLLHLTEPIGYRSEP